MSTHALRKKRPPRSTPMLLLFRQQQKKKTFFRIYLVACWTVPLSSPDTFMPCTYVSSVSCSRPLSACMRPMLSSMFPPFPPSLYLLAHAFTDASSHFVLPFFYCYYSPRGHEASLSPSRWIPGLIISLLPRRPRWWAAFVIWCVADVRTGLFHAGW